MLTYFCATIRDEHRASMRPPPPTWGAQAHNTWYKGQHLSHPFHMASSNPPTRVRLIGGDPTAHLDIIHWMTTCCHQNTIVPLSTIIASPTRFILAMTSVHILGITLLEEELPHLLRRLENEMLDIDTAGRVFASGDNVLPEIREAICTCVAGYFYAGRLQDVDRWMYLGRMNRRFDDGVCEVLERTGNDDKLKMWEVKSPQRYAPPPGEAYRPPVRGPLPPEHAYAMPGAYPTSHVRIDHPHSASAAPPPPTRPQGPFWPQYRQPPYLPVGYDPRQQPRVSYHRAHELRRAPDPVPRTPSPSTSFSRSPSPRTRRVHFDDKSRPPRVPTPPPAIWTPFDTRQLTATQPYYQPHIGQPNQQPLNNLPPPGFPNQGAPHASYVPYGHGSGEFPSDPYRNHPNPYYSYQ